jgi:hypothetical protein
MGAGDLFPRSLCMSVPDLGRSCPELGEMFLLGIFVDISRVI